MTMRLTRRSVVLAAPALALSGLPAFANIPSHGRGFGDNDPVDFNHPAPSKFPVHGLDMARFQTVNHWPTVRSAGATFVWIKATEGGDLLDPSFKTHWRGARQGGVHAGAYHFYYFCTPPEVQAKWFLKNVGKKRGMLPPVLDMEWNPFSPTCTLRPPAKEVRAQMKTFLQIVERKLGQRPVIYTTPEFYKDNELYKMSNEEYWLRTTAKTPAEAYPGQAWRFWQYSGTGVVPGISEETDLNCFNGSADDFNAWLKRRAV